MEQINAVVGRAVGEALEDAGVGVRQAADATGIPLAKLRRKLRGQGASPFDLAELLQLAEVVDRAVSTLIPSKSVL
ncbi:hypothetical protein [Nocardia acidivorans]|uniref:hypothetical protein n=1 Tax=Nocardia acidivorans TaxID=404580 RepID=UPI00082ADA55|nr:hypothetical protein [Nocardia acidivorans]